jgi:hypothetical protein
MRRHVERLHAATHFSKLSLGLFRILWWLLQLADVGIGSHRLGVGFLEVAVAFCCTGAPLVPDVLVMVRAPGKYEQERDESQWRETGVCSWC